MGTKPGRMMEQVTSWVGELGYNDAERAKEKIEGLGGVSILIGNGNGEGCALARASEVIDAYQSECEESLSDVSLIIDFDGVMVHPWQVFMSFLSEWMSRITFQDCLNEEMRLSMAEWLQENGCASFVTLREYLILVRKAESTVLWTSRFDPNKNLPFGLLGIFTQKVLSLFPDWEQRFPFFDVETINVLTRFGETRPNRGLEEDLLSEGSFSKVTVCCGKQNWRVNDVLDGPDLSEVAKDPINALYDMVRNAPGTMYYIGSSKTDREIVIRFLRKHPNLTNKFVFLDTGHFYL